MEPEIDLKDVNRNPKNLADTLNDKEGKFWKHQLINDRLQEIDNELCLIQKDKIKEVEDTSRNKHDDEDEAVGVKNEESDSSDGEVHDIEIWDWWIDLN